MHQILKKKKDEKTGLLSPECISCLYDLTGNYHKSIMEQVNKEITYRKVSKRLHAERLCIIVFVLTIVRTHPSTKEVPKGFRFS